MINLTEKYRPTNLTEIILERSIKNLIKMYIEKQNMPNLLLHSTNPGTGKTTLSQIIIKELDSEYIEINASKERGIDIVREIIEPFSVTVSFNGKRKAILLSECEALTSSAQKSLKDLMERKYSKNVYYILTTNQRDKIISPLRSRCLEINFNYPPKDEIIERLEFICKQENIFLEAPEIDNIVENFYPDIRKMITVLSKVKNGLKLDEAINKELAFYELANQIISKNITLSSLVEKIDKITIIPFCYYLFKIITKKNFLDTHNLTILKALKDTIKDILSGVDEKIAFISNLGEIFVRGM